MQIVTTIDELRRAVTERRRSGRTMCLVPTMGALHAGHLSLVESALEQLHSPIVSIFVNPTQFGPQEDYQRYPRTWEQDLEALEPLLSGAARGLVFAPSVEELYPSGYSTYVEPPRVAQRWEGACRPGHFRGVATVVLKLLLAAQADAAIFGAKDFQQARVIQCMVAELHVPTQIQIAATVREPDGLAMSSRNRYLSGSERQRATAVHGCLEFLRQRINEGERDAGRLVDEACQRLLDGGLDRLDYVALVDPLSLEPLVEISGAAQALIAGYLGTTRLIDNAQVAGAPLG